MGPFVRSGNKTDTIMRNLLIALLPIILFAIYKNGLVPYINNKASVYTLLRPVIAIIVGTFTSFMTEFIYYKFIKKEPIKNKYSIFPGLFLALILPLKTPISVLVLGAIVASASKIIFGGFGKNIFNPALLGYVFVVACYGTYFSTNYYFNDYEIDTISVATPLTNASIVSGIGNYDTLVKPYGSIANFFIGTVPGSFAETSALLCLIALVFLSATKTIKWRIPVIYITTVFVLTFSIGRLLGQGMYYPFFQIFSGGLMFGAVFMATDPVTSAVTPAGQILQGIFLGISTVILRFIGVEGVATSILLMNMFVFMLDKVGVKIRFNFMKSLVWIIIAFVMLIGTIISLAALKRSDGNSDPNFKIVSKNKENENTVYVVTQKGYGGSIKAEVVINDDGILSIEILSNHETKDKYQMVLDTDYINKIISEQNDLNNLDTISGATITSTALKKMAINVMEDYK